MHSVLRFIVSTVMGVVPALRNERAHIGAAALLFGFLFLAYAGVRTYQEGRKAMRFIAGIEGK